MIPCVGLGRLIQYKMLNSFNCLFDTIQLPLWSISFDHNKPKDLAHSITRISQMVYLLCFLHSS